jgi:hypothetical protein
VGGTYPPGVAYVYAPDRKAKQPITHLASLNGILQVDGYGGYRVFAERNDPHQLPVKRSNESPVSTQSRRTFVGSAPTSDEPQAKSRPILDDLEPWLRAKLKRRYAIDMRVRPTVPHNAALGPPQRSASGFFLILIANSTSRLIASARDGRSVWLRRQSSTVRKNCSDTRI